MVWFGTNSGLQRGVDIKNLAALLDNRQVPGITVRRGYGG